MASTMLKQVQSRPEQVNLNNLPQWSRINNLDRARYPKPFQKDVTNSFSPVTADGDCSPERAESNGESAFKTEPTLDKTEMSIDLQKKVQVLEYSISFLKKQHRDVLEALHEEVDVLKRRNNELQFKISMCQSLDESNRETNVQNSNGNWKQKNSVSSESEGPRIENISDMLLERNNTLSREQLPSQQVRVEKKLEKADMTFRLEEAEELKNLLKVEKQYNAQLREELAKIQRSQIHNSGSMPVSLNLVPHPPMKPKTPDQSLRTRTTHVAAVFNASSTEPSQVPQNVVHSLAPTVKNYEGFIKQLMRENEKQALELKKMKSDLREVLYTHKWTPDSYLLAKSYLPVDDSYETVAEFRNSSQRQSLKQSKKLPALVLLPKDHLFLPPLNQSINCQVADRRVLRPSPR